MKENEAVGFKQPTIEQVQAAFRNAGENPEIQQLLRDLYGDAAEPIQVDPRPITERVKTFEDACAVLGNHAFVNQYRRIVEEQNPPMDETAKDIVAYLKLRIIAAALNEGWEPKYVKGEEKWWPWYWLYTQKEIDKMNEKQRAKCVLFFGSALYGADAGFAYAGTTNTPSHTNAFVGSRLCVKSEALAEYFGTQFIKIWQDFYFG